MSRAQLTSTVEQNSAGAASPYTAGKNLVINGAMDIWQRGTSIGYSAFGYCADRWAMVSSGPSFTFSQDTTTVPTGFYSSLKVTAPSSGALAITSAFETKDVLRFAGQTVTLSVYASSSNLASLSLELDYSTSIDNSVSGTWTTIASPTAGTTSTMARYSATFAVPSTAKSLRVYLGSSLSTSQTLNITGVQLEQGSVATPFSRAGGTLQGELALCQRYYWRNSNTTGGTQTFGLGRSTTIADCVVANPVVMRVPATSIDFSGTMYLTDPNVANITVTNLVISGNNSYVNTVRATVASGLSQGKVYTYEYGGGGSTAYMGFSAEL
jgi:hypothetical protein